MLKSIVEIFTSPIMERMKVISKADISDRVLKSTRLEQQIFKELRQENDGLLDLEYKGGEKLSSFKSLVNDTFQSLYSLSPKFIDEEIMSTQAKKLNKYILSDIMDGSEYPTMKSVCEGKELPAMAATEEFTETLLPRLDDLLKAASGQKDSMNVLGKLEEKRDELLEQLSELLHQRNDENDGLDKKILSVANKAEGKAEQADMVSKMVDRNLQKNRDKVKEIISYSIQKAEEKAESANNALLAWGDGNGEMKINTVNTEIIKRVNASCQLKYIAKFLGRFKEIMHSKCKNGYTYGRGQKYDIEYGNSLSKSLTSELSMIATPELLPLFIRKYQGKRLKQYRKREVEYKGNGDIIVCLDESGSTFGENAAWGMAVALVLLEICRVDKRKFALIHFSNSFKTDVYLPTDENVKDRIFETAQTFLNGGTNFEAPLYEAASIISNKDFQKADVVFITDGACDISEDFKEFFAAEKSRLKFSVTGILLDEGSCFDFSLKKFCNQIYRTSQLCREKIVNEVISKRI